MAVAKIIIRKANGGGRASEPMLFRLGTERLVATVTTSASNQILTASATNDQSINAVANAGEGVRLCAEGGAVKIAVGVETNPDATSASQALETIPAGQFLDFVAESNDTRIAVIDG